LRLFAKYAPVRPAPAPITTGKVFPPARTVFIMATMAAVRTDVGVRTGPAKLSACCEHSLVSFTDTGGFGGFGVCGCWPPLPPPTGGNRQFHQGHRLRHPDHSPKRLAPGYTCQRGRSAGSQLDSGCTGWRWISGIAVVWGTVTFAPASSRIIVAAAVQHRHRPLTL
jgi:hypothetical protein